MEAEKSDQLDDRKSIILRAIVQEYIETAQPVGSGHISRAPQVTVSPATVRNDMAVLEKEGFLQQPHTSAGRVPTDKGYRYFVDHLSKRGDLDGAKIETVQGFFDDAHTEIGRMLQDTSRLLSELTDYAGVVLRPQVEDAKVRSVQLVPLTSHLAMTVVVMSNGAIHKHTLDVGEAVTGEHLTRAGAILTEAMIDRPIGSARPLTPSGDATVDGLCGAALRGAEASGPDHGDPRLFVGGAARMAQAFDAVETVRSVLAVLEEQLVMVTLIRDVLQQGRRISIGSEAGVEPLSECSLVVSPYYVDGVPSGSIGVLGPTRMNYPQALAAVAVVSQRLGRRLSEG